MRIAIVVFLLILLGGYGLYSLPTPALDRNWSPDQAIPARATIEGDTVTITNVRNFTYRSTTDYTPGYYDTTVKLSDLARVDFIVEPFGSVGAAHTFVSFGFKDGQQLAVSAEIRKEVGESFSPWLGVLRQYELMYVIADERDVIGLRANHRQHDVYLYPTTATIEEGKQLFVNMLTRANALMTTPEFYNTVTSNCTTNIVHHINELRDEPLSYDFRMLLPAEADALAQELGFIAGEESIDEARAKYRINDRAAESADAADFSSRIRTSLGEVASSTPDTFQVTKIFDGDTIEVKDAAGTSYRVRYIGIDTPEMEYETMTPECLAKEATKRNTELVQGRQVTLTRDVSDTDKYGRLLRYVAVLGEDVGGQLVTEGYAKPLSVPPDVARLSDYRQSAKAAEAAGKGLWGEVCQ